MPGNSAWHNCPKGRGEKQMANELSFLQHAISQSERNNKRKAKPKLLTWDSLPEYFLGQTKKPNKRNFFQTVLSKSNPDFPYEVRLKYQNANVPFGTDGNEEDMSQREHWVTNVPCKDWEQGKKQLVEYIQAIQEERNVNTRRLLALLVKDKPTFDSSTIPEELLEQVH